MCVVSAEQQLASRGGAAGSVTQHDTLCGVVSFDGDDEESGARSSEAARCVSVASSRAETACRRGTVWLGMKPSRVAGRPPHQRHASVNSSTGNDRCPHGHENLPSSFRPRIGPNDSQSNPLKEHAPRLETLCKKEWSHRQRGLAHACDRTVRKRPPLSRSALKRIDLEKLQPLHLISQPDRAKPVGGVRFSRPEKCQRNNRHAIGPAECLRAG
jgi:hypothetical protein